MLAGRLSAQDSLKQFPRPIHYSEHYISLLTGYSFWGDHYGEIGIARNSYGIVGTHPTASCLFVSSEIRIGRGTLIGPKIGGWLGGGAGGVALGANMICYTDFSEYSLCLRPEIGLGFWRFKMTYGYNIALNNKEMEGVNRSCISLAFLFGLRKIGRTTS